VLTGLVVSTILAALLVGRWLDDMRTTGLVRANYAGRRAAFPAGAVLVAVSLLALAPLAVLDDRADLDLLDPGLRQWLAYVLGVSLLGLIDDALGRGAAPDSHRGWRGHAGAFLSGSFSTGAIKAAGALALAAYAVSGRGREGLDYLADLALLLLATNLFNLVDLRPGRVEKLFAVLLAALCLGAWTDAPLELLGIFIGPVAVGAAFTLRERAMLGDTGSNLVGALAGVAMLVTLGDTARWVALGLVAALTIYGEFRSISATIDLVPPLRWLDSIGRLRQGSPKR
jgi:UDP-N-acetylmuramyl pentapeptide phosphotransferase/UDP-N-acetylglucosamine-1-phosphate transferase